MKVSIYKYSDYYAYVRKMEWLYKHKYDGNVTIRNGKFTIECWKENK